MKQANIDKYAKKHLKRVKAGMKNAAALKKRWIKEIEPLIPQRIPSEPKVPLWTAKFFFYSVSLPSQSKASTFDKGYHIRNSGHAILDFTLYSFFEIRRTLVCGLKRSVVEYIDDLYLDYVIQYFQKYFDFTERHINRIIDSRFKKYEEIVFMQDVDIDEELLLSACDFLSKDLEGDPMQKQMIVASADKHFLLCAELSSLLSSMCALILKNIENQLPVDCFLD